MGYLGSSFRRFCKLKGHRFISTASLGMITSQKLGGVIEALNVDAKILRKKGERIKKRLDQAQEV